MRFLTQAVLDPQTNRDMCFFPHGSRGRAVRLSVDRLTTLPLLLQGIVSRDEIVFRAARRRGIPILMVTSGGYQKKTARIIADSILNLHQQGLIGAEPLEGEGSSPLVTSMTRGSGSAGSPFTAV